MLFNLVNLPYWIFLGIGILLLLTVTILRTVFEEGDDGADSVKAFKKSE